MQGPACREFDGYYKLSASDRGMLWTREVMKVEKSNVRWRSLYGLIKYMLEEMNKSAILLYRIPGGMISNNRVSQQRHTPVP